LEARGRLTLVAQVADVDVYLMYHLVVLRALDTDIMRYDVGSHFPLSGRY
jgi:hypothetical protein